MSGFCHVHLRPETPLNALADMTQLSPIPLPLMAHQTQPNGGFDPQTIWRGRFQILAFALVFAVLGAVYSYYIARPIYRTHATLMLEPQEARVIDIGLVLPGMGRDTQILNTQSQVLMSRALVAKLVDDLDLIQDRQFNPALRPPSRLSLRRLYRAGSAYLGIPVRAPRSLTQAQARDGTTNAVIRALRVTIVPDSLVIEVSVGTNSAQKSAQIVNRLSALYVQEQVTAKQVATEQATQWLTDRVVALEQQLDLAEQRARATRTMRGLPTPEQIAQMERQLEALRLRLTALPLESPLRPGVAAQADDLSHGLAEATEALVHLDQLEREADTTRLLYESFLTRLKETTVQTGVLRPDARLLSPAVTPLHPAAPKPTLIIPVALILGAGLGGLWVLARHQWGTRIKTAQDAQRLTGLPVTTLLPEATERRVPPLQTLTRRPNAPLSEAVRDLRSAVLNSTLDHPPKVVMVTSSVAREGRTTQCLLLAQSLATWGKTVLVIEADLRGGTIGRMLDLGARRGVLSVLAGLVSFEQVVTRPAGLPVDILLGERTSASAADIFTTARFDALLSRLRGQYDYVLIDTPAATRTADVRTIATRADLVLYLVRWNATKRGALLRGLAQVRGPGLPRVGLVLTRMAPRVLKRHDVHAI